MTPGESKIRPISVTYVYAGPAPDLTAPSASWYFPVGVGPSPAQIQRLADLLGVQGEIVAVPADQGGGWIVGPQDYSTPTISVGTDSLQSWWYGGGSATASSSEPCAMYPPGDPQGDPATAGLPTCTAPTPPVNVPSEGEARSKADASLVALGLDPVNYDEEVYADEWSASVTAYLKLDGVRTTLSVSFSFGENGALTWASGYFGTPVRGDDYPRIGVEAAVQRLDDQNAMWMTDGAGPTGAVAAAEPPPSTDASGDTVMVDPLPPVGPPDYCDPAACETVPVEPIVVTLSNARPSLEQVWATDGTVWLLPGYTFDADDHGTYSVTAVEDQYLQQDVPVDTAPLDTAPVDTVPVDTVPVPEATVVACGTTLEIHQFDPNPLDLADVQFLVGMCIDDATATADGLSFEVRVARRDGVDLPITEDFRPDRANVVVDNGIVTEILSIG